MRILSALTRSTEHPGGLPPVQSQTWNGENHPLDEDVKH